MGNRYVYFSTSRRLAGYRTAFFHVRITEQQSAQLCRDPHYRAFLNEKLWELMGDRLSAPAEGCPVVVSARDEREYEERFDAMAAEPDLIGARAIDLSGGAYRCQ